LGWAAESGGFLRYAESALKGDREYRAGRYREAGLFYQEALRTAEELLYGGGQVQSLMMIGISSWNLGDLDAFEKWYSRAKGLAKKAGLSAEERSCSSGLEVLRLYRKGKAQRDGREFVASLSSFSKTIRLARKIANEALEAKCLRQMSLTYWETDRLGEFRDANEKALVIARKLNHRLEEARCLNNLGLYYSNNEEVLEALKYFEEGLAILKILDNNEEESTILLNIGRTYIFLGDHNKALEYLNKALNIDVTGNDYDKLAIILANIGSVYRNLGVKQNDHNRLLNAISCFQNSYCLTKDKKLEVNLINNIGFAYANLKQYSSALKYFFSGIKKARNLCDFYATGNIYSNIGAVYLEQGYSQRAIEVFKEAISIALRIGSNRVLWEAYFGLGQSLELAGKDAAAEACYRSSIDCIEKLRNRLFGDEFKADFFENKIGAYERLAGLLFRRHAKGPYQGLAKEMFRVVERAKGKVFLDVLAEDGSDRGVDPALKNKEAELSRQISEIISGLTKFDQDGHRSKILLERLSQKEDEYARLAARIKAERAGGRPEDGAVRFDLEEVQARLLDEKTGLLEYFLGDKASWLLFVTKRNCDVFELPPREAIEDSVKAFVKLVALPGSGPFPGEAAARRIYRELLFPLDADFNKSLERLIIIPDGLLCYLPFEALVADKREPGPRPDYLIHRYQMSYAPSSSSLLLLKDRARPEDRRRGKDLLAVGNPDCAPASSHGFSTLPDHGAALRNYFMNQGFVFSRLPYAEKEVRDIAAYFPENRRELYLGAEATEEAVKKASLRDYKILHFACHGFLDEEEPIRSALVLALNRDRTEDGFLQGREIGALRLLADLVVLSACQTARGNLKRGEGVMGLSRCFFRAGARSVVASLWPIEDRASAIFMKGLYAALVGGKTKAQALRTAKLSVIGSELAHPFYWAGFILSGDGQSSIPWE
jgi:CHAT domain-containing protein/tetratricopeptide (TPR) repeat protein